MGILLTDGQARTLYDFPSGQAATAASTATLEETESYFNIAAIDLDEDLGSITLAISGHRICPNDVCSTLDLTLVSLEDDADVRRVALALGNRTTTTTTRPAPDGDTTTTSTPEPAPE